MVNKIVYAHDHIFSQIDNLNRLTDDMWILICTLMVMLSQVGYMMRETGSIKMQNNQTILLKTILVISVSSLTFFFMGYGLANDAQGGFLGQSNFAGLYFKHEDYLKFIYYFSLCVKMSVIATGSIGERVEIDRYIFFAFLTSGFIFPIGVAWCYSDGWL